MYTKIEKFMTKYWKDILAAIALISLIIVSIKLKYSVGYLVGFLILFLFLVLDHIKRIIFELNVKKVFGIEFGEIERKEIKNNIRSGLQKKGFNIDANSIDEITDTALNQLSGVAYKGRYYEELVSYALSDIGLPYLTDMRGGVNRELYQFDFVVELEKGRVLGIEVAYSARRYLSKEKINQIVQYAEAFKKADNLSHLLLVTNTEVREQDKQMLLSNKPRIDIIENTISPDGVLSQLQYYFNNLDRQIKGTLEN